jgi:MinD-like ATPase involved in chromosome partitioning or flagellar assembly/tetratricopeptide (TPR) repeat protein
VYTITFYSFKGGVGRTMAMVNVGLELVRRGRRVLLVDFDLVAPGLTTYKALRQQADHPGVVEYVTEYMSKRASPVVSHFIYSVDLAHIPGHRKGLKTRNARPAAKHPESTGQLWVMPAGKGDAGYGADLARINWNSLYENLDGYLFFEDTKLQWQETIKPDYVLIDSRTGHTDMGGICTRQLADAVVLLFTPNEQNLAGLKSVCDDIRREETEGLKKKIRLHFVAANVSDLDDEKGVLRRQIKVFRDCLHFNEYSVIRRYESLNLLDQSVFVLDHPRSKLARSYRRLLGVLVKDNPTDRDGSLAFLHDYSQLYLPEVARSHSEEAHRFLVIWKQASAISRINNIAHVFWDDSNVLSKVAECRALEGSFGSALRLFDRVLSINCDLAPALFQRALCKNRLGDIPGATGDLLRYLQTPAAHQQDIVRALQELSAIAPSALREAIKLRSVQALHLRWAGRVAEILVSGQEGLEHAIEYLSGVVDTHNIGELLFDSVVDSLCTCLIHARRWQQALTLIEKTIDSTTSYDVCVNFSLAHFVTSWGVAGAPPKDLCEWWIKHAEDDCGPYGSPLIEQVNGLASWRLGDMSRAQKEIEAAIAWMRKRGRDSFSCWRYEKASPVEFLKDCEQICHMIEGKPMSPAFLGLPATDQTQTTSPIFTPPDSPRSAPLH